MSGKSIDEIAQAWCHRSRGESGRLLGDVVARGCRVWHSRDAVWTTIEAAIEESAQAGGGLRREDVRYRLLHDGFVVEDSAALGDVRFHCATICTVEDGLIVRIEEYLSPEFDLAAMRAEQDAL